MSLPDPIPLERLRYQQGQQLRSRDRRDQVAIEAQLRAWHHRAMHNAFGVAEGFDVEFGPDSVTVAHGLAYDSRGRELILQCPRTVAYPLSSSSEEIIWLLVARFKETSEYPKPGEFDGLCFGQRSTLALESPDFVWRQEKGWVPEDGVPLARIDVNWRPSGQQVVTPDKEKFVRRRARALAKARVVTGETLPGQTSWEPWTMLVGEQDRRLGFQVRIDTSPAGFTQVPCYFAWLQWTSPVAGEEPLAVPFQHIVEEPSFQSFTFRLWFPQLIGPGTTPGKERINQNFATRIDLKQRLYVSWIGIQEAPGTHSTHDHGGKSS